LGWIFWSDQLIDFPFSNDTRQLIKAPLARILALTEVLKKEYSLNEEKRAHLIEKIKLSAEELDLQIRKISQKCSFKIEI
jgi:hypothetical protein